MKIREMELVVRVAETGSMTLAARQLHLTPAAVSAAIQRIEAAIGVRLFERTTRSLHPTDEGMVIIEGCQDVVVRWRRALDDAQGQQAELEGTIHLSAPTDLTYSMLESVIVQLCADHPRLQIVLRASDAVRHLHRDAIDLAIRYGPLQDSTLAARKLFEGPRILVAAPSYLAQHGTPETPQALSHHRCLTLLLANASTDVWALHGPKGITRHAHGSPLCADGYLARRWAIAGLGIAFKSLFDVIDDLEARRLVRVLPDHSGGPSAIHAVFPSRRFLPARVRVLGDAIAKRFAARTVRCDRWLRTPQG
ncbi:MAG: LysR family transcriptional regulator [Myxococcota bacterium]